MSNAPRWKSGDLITAKKLDEMSVAANGVLRANGNYYGGSPSLSMPILAKVTSVNENDSTVQARRINPDGTNHTVDTDFGDIYVYDDLMPDQNQKVVLGWGQGSEGIEYYVWPVGVPYNTKSVVTEVELGETGLAIGHADLSGFFIEEDTDGSTIDTTDCDD